MKKIVSSHIDFHICTIFITFCATGEGLKSPVLYGLAAASFGGALEHRADRTRPPRSESETKNLIMKITICFIANLSAAFRIDRENTKDIMLSVKTTKKNHSTRLKLLLETWHEEALKNVRLKIFEFLKLQFL